jgi:phosphate-selective porin OprO and OprP
MGQRLARRAGGANLHFGSNPLRGRGGTGGAAFSASLVDLRRGCVDAAAPEAPTVKHRSARRICLASLLIALTTPARAQPPIEPATADDKGLTVRSSDRDYVFRVRGLLQVDGRWFFGDPTLDDRDTFLVRRARPILDATLLGMVDVRLVPDFGEGRAQIFDAYIELRPLSWLRLRVGKFKPPVGLERLQSDSDLPMPERALTSNLSPVRDVGAMLSSEILGGLLNLSVGIFDGAPDNGSVDVDSNHAKDVAARVLLQPFAPVPALGVLGLGLAATTGHQRGTVAAPGLPTFRTAGQNPFFSYLQSTDPLMAVLPYQQHDRVNPHLYYYMGGFGLLAEYISSRQAVRRGPDSGDLTHAAWHATASYALGGRTGFDGVTPHRPFRPRDGALGALELSVRIGQLMLDEGSFPLFAAPESPRRTRALAVALNWHLGRSARLGLMFDSTSFDITSFTGDAMPYRTRERALLARTQAAF